MAVTFTKATNRVTINNDGAIYSVTGLLNVFPHPVEKKVLITNLSNPTAAVNDMNNCLVFNVADITTPSAADKNAMVTALSSIFS